MIDNYDPLHPGTKPNYKGKLDYGTKTEFKADLTTGFTNQYQIDYNQLKLRYPNLLGVTDGLVTLIKLNPMAPIPKATDNRMKNSYIWEELEEFSANLRNYLKFNFDKSEFSLSDSYVFSIVVSMESLKNFGELIPKVADDIGLRLVYELISTQNSTQILFTNIDFHYYRTRGYSVTI